MWRNPSDVRYADLCQNTERLSKDERTSEFSAGVEKAGRLKLALLDTAANLDDLRSPPGNHGRDGRAAWPLLRNERGDVDLPSDISSQSIQTLQLKRQSHGFAMHFSGLSGKSSASRDLGYSPLSGLCHDSVWSTTMAELYAYRFAWDRAKAAETAESTA